MLGFGAANTLAADRHSATASRITIALFIQIPP
jgi:hypothetical protein